MKIFRDGTVAGLSILALLGCERSADPPAPATATQSASTVYDFSMETIDGKAESLSVHRGKVLLIVNVASNCGFTPQYEGLQSLHEQYAGDGLVVMGVPSNDFFGQEPGTEAEIKTFCESKYQVEFPMYSKVHVKGNEQHPLYAWLTSQEGKVSWNFNKFLVGRDGRVLKRFGSKTKPLSVEMKAAITGALSESAPDAPDAPRTESSETTSVR